MRKYIALKKIKPTLIPFIIWFIISIILLTLPGSVLPQENWLGKIWFDKWVHIGMFAIMVFLATWGFPKKKWNDLKKLRQNFMWIALSCLLYGIIMEFVQKYWIPNRSFDGGDIIADAAGCTLGLLYSLRRYKKN